MNKHAKRTVLVAGTCLSVMVAGFPGTLSASTGTMIAAQQTKSISGTIVDSNGIPVIGANVLVKGTTNGTITDFDGKFSLSVKKGAEVVISYVGFKSQTLKANGVLNVVLEEDSEMLEEVVVTGYTTQRKADLTGSVAVVSTESLKTTSDTDPMRALQGKVAGMTITGNGSPSGTATVRIRGIGSFNSSQDPLYVIDGVPTNMSLNSLNTNDIESMQVLKDAASASIYGSRASNGVIIITTKKGKKADKVKVDFSANLTAQFYTSQSLMDVCNSSEYATAMAQAALNDGLDPVSYASNYGLNLNAASGTPITVWNPSTSQYVNYTVNGLYDGYINSKKTMRYSDTDWMDEISRVGFSQNYDLSLSHANDKHSTMFSLGYKKNNGILKYTDFENISARMNSSYNVNKYITVGENFTVTYTSQVDCAPMENALKMAPIVPVYEEDGTTFSGPVGGMSDRQNPLREQYQNKDNALNYWRLFGNGYVDIKPFKGFVFRSNFGLDFYNSFINAMTHTYHSDIVNNDIAKTTLSNKNEVNWTWSNTINYNFTVASKHDIHVLLGAELSKQSSIDFSAYSEGYALEDVDYMWPNAATGVMKNTGAKVGYRLASFFGKVDYNYDDFILASFTIRQDGSSRFGKGNRWGTFPGLSVGWRLSEERFIKEKAPFINDLKLRASWGKLGNDRIDPFQYINPYVMEDGAILGKTPSIGKAIYPGVLANPNVTWEKVDSKNVAVDGNFWNGMLGFTVEYFFQNRKDILTARQASIPSYTGLGNTLPDENLGEVNNQGIEIMLNHRNKIGEVNYYIGGNFTFARNKIKFFDEAANIPEWQRQTGGPLNTWLMYKTDGIYQNWDEVNSSVHMPGAQPGDIKYVDVDDNGVISENDKVRSETGNVPEIVYGINYGIEWKGLEVSMMWTGQGRASQMIVPYSYNQDKDLYYNRWISEEETPNSKYPRAFDKDDVINTPWSDFWLYDASFIRLKNVEVAYTLPQKWVEKMKLQNVRFSLSGTNLLTFDKIKLQDPESDATGLGQAYPLARTYSFGINVTF